MQNSERHLQALSSFFLLKCWMPTRTGKFYTFRFLVETLPDKLSYSSASRSCHLKTCSHQATKLSLFKCLNVLNLKKNYFRKKYGFLVAFWISAGNSFNFFVLFLVFSLSRLTHYPIIALLSGSHGLRKGRSQAGPKGCQLETSSG